MGRVLKKIAGPDRYENLNIAWGTQKGACM